MAGTAFLKFDELTAPELDQLDREKTVFMLPISLLEEHGPHLPLGVDVYVADFMAQRIIDLIAGEHPDFTIVKFPPIPIGSGGIRWVGTINSKQRTVRKVLLDYCRNLGRYGFKYLLISNGHGGLGHVVALEEAARIATRRYNMSVISPSGRIAFEFLTGEYGEEIERRLGRPFTEEEKAETGRDHHAGWWETSVMQLIRPELVKDSFRGLKPFYLTRFQRFTNKVYPGDQGYRGVPSLASAEYADAVVNVMLEHTKPIIAKWLRGENVQQDAGSPLYRMLFFRTNFDRTAWVILVLILAAIIWGLSS